MMKSIGKFNRPETSSGAGGVSYAPFQARPAQQTTSYQPPRGPPPSQNIRQTPNSYAPPLQDEVVEEEFALPPPRAAAPSPRAAPSYNSYSGSSSSNDVYPDFKVLQLETSTDGTSNFLPISDLACQLSDLSIGIRKDGKAIEFRRSVQQNNEPRTELQSFNLPYQVSASTCSAKYFPNERNGLLKIQLGKIISGNVPKGEYQLLQFQVPGNPSSSGEKVMIEVDQQPDNYRFYPGAQSRHNTDFAVVLNGKSLEFRSTYSVEESDGSVRTITGKQTVQLPLAPTSDQIDVGYDTVTIWPTRQSGGPVHVPDTDIRIVLG